MTHHLHNSGVLRGGKFMAWESWLDESMNRHDFRSPMRVQQITKLIHFFILERLKTANYTLTANTEMLRNKMATWMYVVDREHHLTTTPKLFLPSVPHRNKDTDWHAFSEIFSDEYWISVRRQLGYEECLFVNERAADYFWANLTYYIYRFLDMVNSLAVKLADDADKELEEEERAFLISEGLLVENKKARSQDDEYYRDAGFYRGDRRYD